MYLSLVPSFQEHILEIVNYLHLSDNHETVPNTDFRNQELFCKLYFVNRSSQIGSQQQESFDPNRELDDWQYAPRFIYSVHVKEKKSESTAGYYLRFLICKGQEDDTAENGLAHRSDRFDKALYQEKPSLYRLILLFSRSLLSSVLKALKPLPVEQLERIVDSFLQISPLKT